MKRKNYDFRTRNASLFSSLAIFAFHSITFVEVTTAKMHQFEQNRESRCFLSFSLAKCCAALLIMTRMPCLESTTKTAMTTHKHPKDQSDFCYVSRNRCSRQFALFRTEYGKHWKCLKIQPREASHWWKVRWTWMRVRQQYKDGKQR